MQRWRTLEKPLPQMSKDYLPGRPGTSKAGHPVILPRHPGPRNLPGDLARRPIEPGSLAKASAKMSYCSELHLELVLSSQHPDWWQWLVGGDRVTMPVAGTLSKIPALADLERHLLGFR